MKSDIGHGNELLSIPCSYFSPSPVSLLGCSREDAEKPLGIQTWLPDPQLLSSPGRAPCPHHTADLLQPAVRRGPGVGGKEQSPRRVSAFGKGAVGVGVWALQLPISPPFWRGAHWWSYLVLHPQPGPAAGLGAVHGGSDGADGRAGQREDAGERDGGGERGSGGDMVPSGMRSIPFPEPRALG